MSRQDGKVGEPWVDLLKGCLGPGGRSHLPRLKPLILRFFFFSDFMSHLLVSFSLGRVCHWHNFWPIKIEGKEWPGN